MGVATLPLLDTVMVKVVGVPATALVGAMLPAVSSGVAAAHDLVPGIEYVEQLVAVAVQVLVLQVVAAQEVSRVQVEVQAAGAGALQVALPLV